MLLFLGNLCYPPLFTSLTAANDHRLRLHVRKQPLADDLYHVAACKVDDHRGRELEHELSREVSKAARHQARGRTYEFLHLDDLQPPVHLGHEVCRTRERDGAGANKAPEQCRVLADSLAEWSALERHSANIIKEYMKSRAHLEVDGERRHLLRQTQEVDGGVE